MDTIIRWTKTIFSFILYHIFTIACVILFFVISWKFEFFYMHKREFALATISLIFIMHLFSRVKYNIIFTILFSIIVTSNFYFAFALNTYLNAGIFGSIMDTNTNEVTSMMKDIWTLVIPMFIFTFFLIFMSVRELKKSIIPLKISAIGLSIYLLFILPFYMLEYVDWRNGIRQEVREQKLIYAELSSQKAAPILYGNIATVVNYVSERIKFYNFYNIENKTLSDGLRPNPNRNDSLPEKIYLIFGESATRKHLSAYGYQYPTSPYLDSIARVDTTVTLYNGYSSAVVTRDAFRQVLTSCSPHDMDAFLYTKSLIDMANDQGYETIWISPFSGMFRQHSGTYLQLLASGANEYRYVSTIEDLDYIPVAKEYIVPGKKQLILMGLSGSHVAYKDRYDAQDAEALPADPSISQTILDYNRTIHHTDRFLRKSHELIANDSSSVMIYFSDHGELIGKGHGMNYGKSQIEIPMVTINKSSVKLNELTSKYTYLHEGKESLNSISFFYIISEMLGYSVSDEKVKHRIEESKYVYYGDMSVGLATDMKEAE